MPQKMSPTLAPPESSMPVSSTDKKISRRATELYQPRTLRFKPSVSSRSVDHSPPRASRIPTAQMKPRTPASPMAAVAPSPALAHATAILTGRKSLHKTELLRLPETKPRPNQAGVLFISYALRYNDTSLTVFLITRSPVYITFLRTILSLSASHPLFLFPSTKFLLLALHHEVTTNPGYAAGPDSCLSIDLSLGSDDICPAGIS